MNTSLLPWMMSFVSLFLLAWAGFVRLSRGLRLPTYNLRWKFAFAALSLTVAALPVGPHSLARVVTGCGFVPSIPFLFILADVLIQDLRGEGWLSCSECQAVWWWGALAGLALYPSALGLGRFDAYGLGWGFTPLCVFVAALAGWLVWRSHRLGMVLVLSAAAWQGGVLESANYWDYLVDPVYFTASLVALAFEMVRSRQQLLSSGMTDGR